MTTGAPPELSVLVVSYNTRELTLACLESLERTSPGIAVETIVVDNASGDGSANAIAERFPRVQVVAEEENLGFAGATNLAARRATGRYLLLLNPDTLLFEGTLAAGLAFARAHPDAGVFGGRTLFPDRSLNHGSCWARPTWWSLLCHALGFTVVLRRNRFFDPESLGSWSRDSVREVDVVSGCFLLITRELWEELGGLDEGFFMYGEDADLCLRAQARGRRCLITPEAELVHYGGASERVRADKMVSLFRAKARLFAKHWSPAGARFGIHMLDMWAFSRMLAFRTLALLRPSRRESADTWQAIWRRRAEWEGEARRGASAS